MTQASTDYLYVITPPVQDRSFATSSSDGGDSFDDHLSQAASSASDESRTSGAFQQPRSGETDRRSDRNVTADQGAQPKENVSKPATEQRSDAPKEPASSNATEESQAPKSKAEEANGSEKHEEPRKRDSSSTVQLAAVVQPAVQNAQKTHEISSPARSARHAVEIAPEKSHAKESATDKVLSTTDKRELTPQDLVVAGEDHPQVAAESDATHSQENGESSAAKPASKSAKKQTSNTSGEAASHMPDGKSLQNQPTSEHTLENDVPTDGGTHPTSPTGPAISNIAAKATSDSRSGSSDDEGGPENEAKLGSAPAAAESRNKLDAAQFVNAAANIPNEPNANAAAGNREDEKPIKAAGPKQSSVASLARLARTAVGVDRDNSANSTDDVPQVDPARFVGRVAKAFQTAHDRGGSLQIRLSPPELGALRLELTVKDGVMSASLQTETTSARRLLLDHLPTLRDRLAEQNIRVDRFDVDVRRDGTNGQADARGSQHQQFQQQLDQPAPRQQHRSGQQVRETAAPEIITSTPQISDAGLNLII